jgi:hypothetical protein
MKQSPMIARRRRRRNRGEILVGLLLRLTQVSSGVAQTLSSDLTTRPALPWNDPSFDDPARHGRSWPRSLQQAVSDSSNNATTTTTSSFDVQSLCAVVEQAFASSNVTCKCAGAVVDNFSITCDYREPICSADHNATCGVPQMALAMVHGEIFSATTCISDYRRGAVALQDTCVFVDACVPTDSVPTDNSDAADRPLFCGCTASYGGAICQTCHVCDGAGTSITVDCSNVNAEAITTACTALDVDLRLSDGAGQLAGFAPPTWTGFCSALEGALENRIACDCTNAVGDSYNVTCRTMDASSTGEDGAVVASTAAVVEGTVRSVTACAADRVTRGTTCTTVSLSTEEEEPVVERETIAACSATYQGDACQSCTLCDAANASQQSIWLDCSNVHAAAVTRECQAINVSSSYEFVPDYGGTPGISLPSSAAALQVLGIRTGIAFWGILLGFA